MNDCLHTRDRFPVYAPLALHNHVPSPTFCDIHLSATYGADSAELEISVIFPTGCDTLGSIALNLKLQATTYPSTSSWVVADIFSAEILSVFPDKTCLVAVATRVSSGNVAMDIIDPKSTAESPSAHGPSVDSAFSSQTPPTPIPNPIPSSNIVRDIFTGRCTTHSGISVYRSDLQTIQHALALHTIPHKMTSI
ncbi:hypothetical protein R3P38DRAFT_3237411 [Favolaschia claudopus]|uniref:Uncharacterized protein n=1 Tax=Favolaschia claudopus TaxID=2862362 RepID=A0AAV9ZBJ7_9AGAR